MSSLALRPFLPLELIPMRAALLVLLFSSIAFAQESPTLQFRGPGSKHATIAPAPATATPGGKATLVLDMAPNEGIHVYAPGAKDYIPVKITLKPHDAVKPGKLTYPKSEKMYFAPLNETVQVYQKPFRLSQDITLASTVASGTRLVVDGTLEFQACDDKVCFVPETVPVSWTVSVK
jgi:DsbC/DsbD-like thiol-disulfide interchange protein